MGIGKWFKKKMAMFALATSSVEKNVLTQDGVTESSNTAQIQRHRQGTLADALTRGELTQEVKDLRWRMYKVLDASSDFKTKVIGYDEEGYPITETVATDRTSGLSKIKVDTYDDYTLELVVNNDEATLSISDVLVENSEKNEKVIICGRDFSPKFKIENFSKKMNVRTISKTDKLLEFYVPLYPNEEDRRSYLFISEIKKGLKNPRICDFLDIQTVSFISNNTIGVRDLMSFEYKINKFDKIIEFDGYYVIKFNAIIIKDGESIVEKFRETDLDEKYKNKERKKDR